MALNTLLYGSVLQEKLDESATRALTSGWMDANAGQVEYNGGNKIKIPKISTTGLKDYDRDDGYPSGSVTMSYDEYEMTMDRGASFQLDAMDVNETNFFANATRVTDEFQTENVIPEIDAYRYSKLYALLKAASRLTAYTAEEKTVMDMLLSDIAKIRDEIGEDVPLVISIAQAVKTKLEQNDKFVKQLNVADFRSGEINTQLKQINNCFLKPVPSSRMKTAYVFKDGKTEGEKEGGFAPAASAKQVNWIITTQDAPIAVTKQDKMKVIDPDTYQKADAWFLGYRRYHELWLLENRYKKCWVNAEAEA
ncbi:MAG: hypothetical protein HFI60_08510 [Lachnospiraceae bacterium]|jgi:hypothetical protein|nr:hypothetical protein [Lachnospiraceae bacterium]